MKSKLACMSTSISRRAITRGALWAVPSAVVVGAAPAFAASSPTTASVCSTLQFGQYDAATNTYPLGITFGGTEANATNVLRVSVFSPAGEPPSAQVGISNPCDGVSSVGETGTPSDAPDGTVGVWVELTGQYFDFQASQCGPCPFIAVFNQGLREGDMIRLESTITSETGATTTWMYEFSVDGWGSQYPTVVTRASTNLAAPLNVKRV